MNFYWKKKIKNGENLGTALGPFLAQGLGLLAQPSVHCGLASPRGAARALGGHRTQSRRGGTAGWYDGEGEGRPTAPRGVEHRTSTGIVRHSSRAWSGWREFIGAVGQW
jgi:hypothetical protein